MLNYLAFVWNEGSASEGIAAAALKMRVRKNLPEWRVGLDKPGMFVCLAPRASDEVFETYDLVRGRGLFVGRLFPTSYVDSGQSESGIPPPVVFDDYLTAMAISDGGKTLTEIVWGAYVAFLIDSEGRKKWVLRDPSGQIPCQRLTRHGVNIYFMDFADVERVERVPLQVNRHFIIGSFCAPNAHSGETALDGISTVLPGHRVLHAEQKARVEAFWDAVSLASKSGPTDFASARVSTRRIVRACVHAWASCFDNIFLQLSGGLDSSIVAACLADAPNGPNVVCANFHCKYESSDERLFAREVATRFGFELMEIPAEDHETVSLCRGRASGVMPTSIAAPSNTWRETLRRLAERNVCAHMRGDGGDELFHKGGALPDAVDVAFRRRLTGELLAIGLNDAMVDRTSIWEVLRLSIRHGFLRRPYDWKHPAWLGQRLALLHADVRQAAIRDQTHWHPLYRQPSNCPPGKLAQSFSLLKFTNRIHAEPLVENALTTFSPLVSQPHMEFALRTPLSVLRTGARDRSAARSAFASDLPVQITYRKYKGLGTRSTGDWVSEYASEARELLLDGYLVSERIVDRRALEAFLATTPSRFASMSPDLMMILCIEVWIRDARVQGRLAA